MECILFGAVVIVATAAWVYVLRDRSFTFLAYAMYFPGAAAIIWSAMKGSLFEFLYNASGVTQPVRSVLFSVVSVMVVYGIVNSCVFLATALGWAKRGESRSRAIHGHNRVPLAGFLRASGEELGWRCFLLPCLLQIYSPFISLLISGTVWGLYHVPVMILLAQQTKLRHPFITVVVQCVSCIFAAFTHGWVSMKSGHTLWAPSIMHWFWNIYNPTVLGSIYTNTPGQYTGEQWKINGEGLMGCLVMAPLVFVICWETNAGLL